MCGGSKHLAQSSGIDVRLQQAWTEVDGVTRRVHNHASETSVSAIPKLAVMKSLRQPGSGPHHHEACSTKVQVAPLVHTVTTRAAFDRGRLDTTRCSSTLYGRLTGGAAAPGAVRAAPGTWTASTAPTGTRSCRPACPRAPCAPPARASSAASGASPASGSG